MVELKDKIAVITGAGSGIGEAIAKALSNNGVSVALAGRNEDKLQAVAQQLNVDTKVIPTDVTKKDSVDQMLQVVKGHFGKVDIVVNSAGQSLSSKITDYDVEQWDTMIDVNVKGTLYVLQAALPYLLNQSSGHIINIASISGFEVTKSNAVYSATKAAIHTITQALEKELARTGVKVTSISPGMVESPMTEHMDFGDRKKLETRDIAEAVVYTLTQPSHVNVNEVTVRPV
ncbi:SDR family oxidoreductase [Staphylococcus caprae]|uniref:Oxidoreductase n=1 Tax=Staphylococcus caprae TaxID=29380 RepID=A0ABM7FT36_9STAP|nr:SDR family oxidoreductase [Staphylococcus caprae]EES41837.1 oxidoreductase, short chain dehydrogenase/reductase family protein [Staphylococcus caprae M23864:W1]MBN6826239.1 SDR family oxidoreductase [Staphylococcus caprae]MDI0014469.1 SDR family oxidoreductase [Staphylococcus caprae]MEB8095139.1 SDR family oxidoreductase [Staphylococcus caprae]PAK64734.1 oxidoreductase [Staphylococcus caprae]